MYMKKYKHIQVDYGFKTLKPLKSEPVDWTEDIARMKRQDRVLVTLISILLLILISPIILFFATK